MPQLKEGQKPLGISRERLWPSLMSPKPLLLAQTILPPRWPLTIAPNRVRANPWSYIWGPGLCIRIELEHDLLLLWRKWCLSSFDAMTMKWVQCWWIWGFRKWWLSWRHLWNMEGTIHLKRLNWGLNMTSFNFIILCQLGENMRLKEAKWLSQSHMFL